MILINIACGNDSNNSDNAIIYASLDYVYPENGTAMIPINHKFILHFDIKINAGSVLANTTLKKTEDSTIVALTLDNVLGSSYNTFVLKPSALLDKNKEYTLTISKKIQPLANIELEKDQEITFTTADSEDLVPVLNVSSDMKKECMKLVFNELLNPLEVTLNTIELVRDSDEKPITRIIEYDFENKCVIVYPQETLQDGVDYKLDFGGSLLGRHITDLGGQTLSPGTITFSF